MWPLLGGDRSVCQICCQKALFNAPILYEVHRLIDAIVFQFPEMMTRDASALD